MRLPDLGPRGHVVFGFPSIFPIFLEAGNGKIPGILTIVANGADRLMCRALDATSDLGPRGHVVFGFPSIFRFPELGPRRPRTPLNVATEVPEPGGSRRDPRRWTGYSSPVYNPSVILLDPSGVSDHPSPLSQVIESSVPRCGMKPYCRVCSFGIICHWMRQTSILPRFFPLRGGFHGTVRLYWSSRPYLASGITLCGATFQAGKYPSCKHLFAMARNNPRSRKMAAWHISEVNPSIPGLFWD
ncbi:hypothetical protein EVAR_9234_1 [Eumeta japonica]|uniref:Uncharacterized protein n=1 Tax=Eumeta variegata TaxID=151549 RepID=A0A4C2AEG8_EUMVA|nr:hypothetical protein EVAR_9234_1 [Eumeta japonica]